MDLSDFFSILIISSTISAVFACNGYQIKTLDITPCDGYKGEVISFDNFGITLTEDCKAVPSGCLSVKKLVTGGEGKYNLVKKSKVGMPLKMNGKLDICKTLEESKKSAKEIQLVIKLLGFEQKCPIKTRKTCPTDSIDISEHKSKLGMLEGESDVTVTAKTKEGEEVCYKASVNIIKSGGGAAGFMG